MKVFIFGDTHIPIHDLNVTKLIMKVAHHWKPDLIIHTGDLYDCTALGTFPKDPVRTKKVEQEIRMGHAVLAMLPETSKKVFCMGNHEDRIRKYMWKEAPELWWSMTAEGVVGLESLGWTVVPYLESFKMGSLVVTHDFGRSGKTAVADAMRLHPNKVVVIGHTHRLQHVSTGEGQVPQEGFSTGWGGQVEAITYSHHDRCRHEWQPGFVAGHMDSDGWPHLQTVPILNRTTCYFNNQKFSVED